MKIFLTGASGFIGSHVARALLEHDHRVAALVMPDDPMPRLQNLCASLDIVRGSLGDAVSLEKYLDEFRPEACVHLAWYAEPGKYLDADENLQSLSESLALFKMLIAAGCRRIAAAGTCFEYDTDYGYLQENTPARPATLYAASKLSCFLTGSQMARRADVSFAWGRIFYPYGPMEDPRRLVSAAIASLQKDLPFAASAGGQIRDYIHVADVAFAFCALVEEVADGVFNISTGTPVTVRTVLETIELILNRPGLIRRGALPSRTWEPPFICGNNTRLKTLGWHPSFSLTDGLADTIRFLKAESDHT